MCLILSKDALSFSFIILGTDFNIIDSQMSYENLFNEISVLSDFHARNECAISDLNHAFYRDLSLCRARSHENYRSLRSNRGRVP